MYSIHLILGKTDSVIIFEYDLFMFGNYECLFASIEAANKFASL